MAGPRNLHGVNDSTDCYRTVNGQRYEAWAIYPSNEMIKTYRASGVRCRRFGEELFVHSMDMGKAANLGVEE